MWPPESLIDRFVTHIKFTTARKHTHFMKFKWMVTTRSWSQEQETKQDANWS